MLTKDLVYFCEIVQRGSINRAAAALSVTQPTLTKSLQRLERELQVKLLERTSAGVSLTPIGEVFYERTQALGSEVEAVIKTVRDLRLGLSGEVRFGVTGTVPFSMIASACRTFAAKRPGVCILLRSGLFLRSKLPRPC